MEVTRLFDILDYRNLEWHDRPVFSYKENGEWAMHGIDEYRERSCHISYALLSMGVQRGENIALISTGRPEWNYVDMGVQMAGAVLVPIYPTISEDDYLFILNNAQIRFLIIEGNGLVHKIANILPKLANIQEVFTINVCEGYRSLADLYELGRQNSAPDKVKAIKDSITANDTATMIYTSGTTGVMKGVMISHKGLLTNVMGIKESPAKWWMRSLSWLPLCHVYERMMNYLYQYIGLTTYYAENVGKVAENAKEVGPHIMAAVPRFIEKVYDKIYRKGQKLNGIKRKLFFWALEVGAQYDVEASKLSLCYRVKRWFADKLVFSTIRDSLGGSLKMLVSGGAAIQPRLMRFFSCIGLDLYEGYGLTECSPLVAVTNSKKGGRRVGSVGFALPGIDVRIDKETNEIQCRGDNVMKGYYNSPDLTAEVTTTDGWFRTGDTGYFDADGFLFLTGRTKSMFKTSMGKFVNPEVIEEKMKESSFVLEMMVVGEGQKFAAALIAPDFDMLADWCRNHGVDAKTRQEMIANPVVLARYQRVVDKYNKQLGTAEQVKRFHLVAETWNEANKFLTPTLKIRRKVIYAAYQEVIEKMFA